MKIHSRNTYQSGADRMFFDNCWHSSKPLDKIQIGDILKIKNKETFEVVDWKVTELPIQLAPDEAKVEWLKYPFGNFKTAEKYGYFPFVLRNLEKIKKYPPEKLSPRYIPSEVRIKVWLRDDGKCKRCGIKEDLEFDHIIPVSKGGSNTDNNIELLCKSCNRKKSDRIQ
ncbi:hypothetical protein DRN85_04550 [Methanosarcinales archaeon]|nr:MAG: hypothetical protein DRN85_04550 [Methanosarcinales archaeon]